jgi:hypothetical protein
MTIAKKSYVYNKETKSLGNFLRISATLNIYTAAKSLITVSGMEKLDS